jgi:hypothetical protein
MARANRRAFALTFLKQRVAVRRLFCDVFGNRRRLECTKPAAGDFARRCRSLFAIAIGFAVAGSVRQRLSPFRPAFPSFRLLEVGPMPARFAAVPLLIFSAPFLIMRNTLARAPARARRAEFVMVATVIAGLWSLMSGTVVVMALQALLSV